MKHGVPTACLPDHRGVPCIRPFVDHENVNGGGPHKYVNANADIDGGHMDGFVHQARDAEHTCRFFVDPACDATLESGRPDALGYHTESDLPNYWAYARNFVLQDHMFEPDVSWSLPSHLFLVSEWAARCTTHDDPFSCRNVYQSRGISAQRPSAPAQPTRPDLRVDRPHLSAASSARLLALLRRARRATRLQQRRHRVHVGSARRADTGNLEPAAVLRHRPRRRPAGQHPARVAASSPRRRRGTLPAVSWVVPSQDVSEHPPAPISAGVAYVTGLDQRGDAGRRLEARPRSSWRGTTGAASTTTWCRRSSTRTATACGSPGS